MNANELKTLRQKIEKYALAMVADSWSGSGEEDDYEILFESLQNAKAELDKYLEGLKND